MPFATPYKRASHFLSHGHEFGATTAAEYEGMADAFMSQVLHPDLYECIRTTGVGDRVRLDGAIRYYGVAFNIIIRTFHTKSSLAIGAAGGPRAYVNRKCAERK